MAHLEVEPKPKRPLWIYALIILILMLLGFTLFKYYHGGTDPSTDKVPDSLRNELAQ